MDAAANFRQVGKKIIGVGPNYWSFLKEQEIPAPDRPMLFWKPASSYLSEGSPVKAPKGCNSLYYEVELGVVIGKTGKDIPESSAMDHVAGYALALDMTAMDLLKDISRKQGHPWAIPKGFDTSCPVSRFIPRDQLPDPHNVRLWLKLNGVTKQDENTSDMIFSLPTCISYISEYFTLEPGDLIVTGTPSGLGPTVPGDTIECGIGDIISMQFSVSQ